jgi:hypothetical protein
VALAEEVARLAGVSKTEAIRLALERLRDELQTKREERSRAIHEVLERAWAKLEGVQLRKFGDDDLYDDHGLPK